MSPPTRHIRPMDDLVSRTAQALSWMLTGDMSMAVVKKNVIPMPVRPGAVAARMSERKWGRDVMEARNFCIFPSLLLHAQARLKMTPTHLALVMHLIDFWWHVDRKPWPS